MINSLLEQITFALFPEPHRTIENNTQVCNLIIVLIHLYSKSYNHHIKITIFMLKLRPDVLSLLVIINASTSSCTNYTSVTGIHLLVRLKFYFWFSVWFTVSSVTIVQFAPSFSSIFNTLT